MIKAETNRTPTGGNPMEFIIISGLSGAGKSRATVQLEDLGYYCVDNIPVDMIPVLADICAAGGPRYEKTAVVADIRTLSELFSDRNGKRADNVAESAGSGKRQTFGSGKKYFFHDSYSFVLAYT